MKESAWYAQFFSKFNSKKMIELFIIYENNEKLILM